MDNITTFMSRIAENSQKHQGSVKTNPTVGAMLINGKKIIREGYHEVFGQAHAEVNAIKNISADNIDKMTDATLLVTLEPCFHTGKTPPCVNLILEKKIKKVVVATTDPNPRVNGKSIALLNTNNVNTLLLEDYSFGKKILTPFLINQKAQRPYVILKYAESADGFLGKPDHQIWLTNAFSKLLSHRWRSEVDAIVVGRNTVKVDNPSLDNRLYWGNSPVRIVFDSNLSLENDKKIFNAPCKTLIINNVKSEINGNLEYVKFSNFQENLLPVLHFLFTKNFGKVLVEGGAELLQSFIDADLWDEARIFKTHKIIGKNGIKSPILPNLHSKNYKISDDELSIFFNKKNQH